MTKKELTRAIRDCHHIYAKVVLTEHDTVDLKITKVELLYALENWNTTYWDDFRAYMDEDNDLFIG